MKRRITEDGVRLMAVSGGTNWKGQEGAFWVLEIFYILIWMEVTQVCTYVKLHQALHVRFAPSRVRADGGAGIER